MDKVIKDIKGLLKVQDKAKFLRKNIPYERMVCKRYLKKNIIHL